MTLNVERLEVLLLVAAIVAMAARRLRLPYTVELVLAGVGLAVFPLLHVPPLTKEMIFIIFLPPLIFEAAFHMRGASCARTWASFSCWRL